MAKHCGVCTKIIDSGRICFDCMFDLAEEERILRIRNSKWSHPGGGYYTSRPGSSLLGRPWVGQQCNRCWPADCGCM